MMESFGFNTLLDPTVLTVLIGCTVLGLCAGAIGCFAILRKRALVSDAIAHASLPGICVAFLITGEREFFSLLSGAFIFGLLAATSISLIRRFSRIRDDALTALAIGGYFGLGIVLSRIIQNRSTGSSAGLDGFIFGKAASLIQQDIYAIVIVATVTILIVAVFFKEFSAIIFDRNFCSGLGWPVLSFELLIVMLITACVVVAIPATGVVLIVSLLIIPGLTARFWTKSLGNMVILAGILGMLSSCLGVIISTLLPLYLQSGRGSWPTGPSITLVASTIFFLSMLLSPSRGILSDHIRQRRLNNLIRRPSINSEKGQK